MRPGQAADIVMYNSSP